MTTFAYIISTNTDYENIAVPRLLASLHRDRVPPELIHVFVGRSDRDAIEHLPGCVRHLIPFGAYEHTALIGAIEHEIADDYVFLLHDTCEVEPGFRWLANSQHAPGMDMTTVHGGMCGFGMYSMEFLRRVRDNLTALKGCDKHAAMVHEGFLSRQNLGSHVDYPDRGEPTWIERGRADIYGQGIERLIEFYPQVNLIKYKANYGNTGHGSYIERA